MVRPLLFSSNVLIALGCFVFGVGRMHLGVNRLEPTVKFCQQLFGFLRHFFSQVELLTDIAGQVV